MKNMRSITAITNPLINSYKRLVPGYEAPMYIAWSASNRSPLIRIPASRGASTRIELRSPDPACNPYLALAVTLMAGLDGIKNKIEPPPPADKNLYEMSDEEREKEGIYSLPRSLEEAVYEMKRSEFAKEVLGEHVFNKFLEAKEKEIDQYNKRVSQWEIDAYLTKY